MGNENILPSEMLYSTLLLRNQGKELCTMRGSGALDVDRAVLSAKEAQPKWGSLTGLERGKIMAKAGRIIKVH